MRTLTKTGIRILSAKYRSILIKCAIINASMFIGMVGTSSAMAVEPSAYMLNTVGETDNYNYYDIVNGTKTYYQINPKSGTHYEIGTEGTADFSIKSIKPRTSSYSVTPQGISEARVGVGDFTGTIGSESAPVVFHSINVVLDPSDPDKGGAVYNHDNADGYSIYADFVSNTTTNYGGGVRNGYHSSAIIDKIVGNFVKNEAGTVGGAIANGSDCDNTYTTVINEIIGNFIGNSANNGGAIQNQRIIGTITGDFLSNSSTNTGGAIRNSWGETDPNADIANITKITGNFISNTSNNGGAIYNDVKGTINEIEGDFILNTATTNGGAIRNSGTIGNTNGTGGIEGNFVSNTAQSGSAIWNESGTITNIIGDFTFNTSTNGYGAIYNKGTIGNTDGTGGIEGNFVSNAAKHGSAIANAGTITKIIGNFTNNSATNNGGAILNSQTINKVTGNFTNNSAQNGGAIYNGKTINFVAENGSNITFDGNYVTSDTGKGGAIYNYNTNTIGLYANDGHSITFLGEDNTTQTLPDDAKDIDGIYNEGILNINGNGTDQIYAGTVNLYNVSDAATAKGTTNIYGGTVNVAKDITQKAVSVSNGATLTTNGNVTTTDGITNAGTLNLLGGTSATRAIIASTILGDGTTNFGNGTDNAYIQLNGAINQAMNIKEKADIETNANNIGAAVTNAGILNLGAGTLAQNVTGNGSIVTKGDVISNASNLGNTVTNTDHTLTLTEGTLKQAISGGNVTIAGDITSSNASIASVITVNEGKSLTIGAGNVGGAVTNDGTLILNAGALSKAVAGTNGVVDIQADTGSVTTTSTASITNNIIKLTNGTLDVTGLKDSNSIDLSGATKLAGAGGRISTIDSNAENINLGNVDTTSSNIGIGIDVNYAGGNSDVLSLNSFTGTNKIVVDTLNVIENPTGTPFSTNIANGLAKSHLDLTATTFNSGTDIGNFLISYDNATGDLTGNHSDLTNAITSTLTTKLYNMTSNESINNVTLGGTSLSITANGKAISAATTGDNGVTIASGQTLSINGGTISGFNTALINEGTLNLENVVFSGNTTDVSNTGILNLLGENTFGSKLTGTTGTVTNSGTLNVGATNLDVALTNNGALNLEGGTLGKAVTGTGTITTTGNVLSIASYLGNDVTNIDHTLTLTGGALDKTITGGNVTIDGDVTSNASIASAIAINTTKSLSISADNVDGEVANAGTLNLGTGTLAQNVTGNGSIVTKGDVTSNASNLGNVITNTGHTLTLTGGQLEQTVTGGNVTIDGDVTSNSAITSAIDINAGKTLTISADNVDGIITNAGTLNLGAGTLAQNVNGTGITNISGGVVIDANKDIINTVKIAENSSLELNAGLIGATKANITENLGTVIMNGGTLSSNVAGFYETKVGGSAVTTTTAYLNDNFTNKGTLNLTSDIDKDIQGNGTTVLSKEGSYVSVIGNRIIAGTLNTNGKAIDMQSPLSNVSYNTLSVGTLNLGQDISLILDSNILTQEIDKISANSITGNGKINMLLDIPNRIDTALTDPNITLNPIDIAEGEARTNLAKALRYEGHSITSPIFEYTTSYDENTGLIHVVKKTGTDGFNKYLYAPSVVANTTATMTTQIATLAMDKMDDVVQTQGRSGGDTTTSSNAWVKVMGLNDNVEFNNFENIDSKALTVAAGYNTNKITCGDCDIVLGAYAGYIGGKQQYTANDIDQDGGYVGLSSALTLGNAFLTATVNGGLLKNKANNMYGTDRFNTLWLGTGLKAGYNYAITDSVVLQPNVYGGYTLVNTKDYTSVSGVKIATNNLNFFEVDPGLKLSAVIADGWTTSVQGKYAIVMDNGADITANDIALQNISTKNYFEYGIGIDKSVTDAFYLGAKVNRHDGGRTGWNGSIEFRYKF